MESILGYTLEELTLWMQSQGEPSFRAVQVMEWLYRRPIQGFQDMSNLSKTLRDKLCAFFAFSSLKTVKMQNSEDQETIKFLWELSDSKKVESVLILSGQRHTVCVSSQVGCPARCAFCASGKEGLIRNLSAGEIVEQVVAIHRHLKEKGEGVTHIVFMGMGEPLENYDAVVKAIEILHKPYGLNISQRRITVSTVGVVEGIHRLSREAFKVNLVLSLHAPNQHIRKKIIPYARRYPLEEILLAMDFYAKQTKRDITYEYTLLEGINDKPDMAVELAELLKGKQCTVNLIPYNPVSGLSLKRPSGASIEKFRDILEKADINTTWRYTKGTDIAAACGQLALISD